MYLQKYITLKNYNLYFLYHIYIMIYYILIILVIFIIINQYLNNKEHFLTVFETLNEIVSPKISNKQMKVKDIKVNKNELISEGTNQKNYIIYVEKEEYKDKTEYNFKNGLNKIFLNIKINKKQKIILTTPNNKKIGKLISQKYNKYIFDFNPIYKKKYIFEIKNNYNVIKIYSFNKYYNIYYLKRINKNEYECYLFDKKIGTIEKDKSQYKIEFNKDYFKTFYLFSSAFILMTS